MNVYVESNFVLEHALEQEECDSCSEIIQLASRRQVTLLIPAFSLAEPHQAIAGKAKVRLRLGEEQVETTSRDASDFWRSSGDFNRKSPV
jgi:hypothetical protein